MLYDVAHDTTPPIKKIATIKPLQTGKEWKSFDSMATLKKLMETKKRNC